MNNTSKTSGLQSFRLSLITLLLMSISSSVASGEKDTISSSKSFKFPSHIVANKMLCDGCGSAGGGSMGFSSMLNYNFVGVRYLYQSYSSRNGVFSNSPWVDENFNTLQLWSRIPVNKKLQVSVLVPYHFHNRERQMGNESINGLGDITVLAMYSVIQTKKDSATFSHRLQFGGGVKAPTGKYELTNNSGSVNPSFQVGTGSWDYMFAAEYVVNHKKIGLNSMLNYTFKTENDKEYQFGNQLNYGSTLFYIFDVKKVKLVPQIGFAGEVYEQNHQYKQALPGTEGNILFGKFGLEAGKDRFSFGINTMLPISQNLTDGKVEANYRIGINLNYSL